MAVRRRGVPVDEVRVSGLLVFEGFRYRTDREWAAAFAEFRNARAVWAEQHPGVELAPFEVNGSCPIDYSRFRKSKK